MNNKKLQIGLAIAVSIGIAILCYRWRVRYIARVGRTKIFASIEKLRTYEQRVQASDKAGYDLIKKYTTNNQAATKVADSQSQPFLIFADEAKKQEFIATLPTEKRAAFAREAEIFINARKKLLNE